MNSRETTTRASIDLDATDEFPVLDTAAYEAAVLPLQSAEPSDNRITATAARPSVGAAAGAEELSRTLAETGASLEALRVRERALRLALANEQQAAQRSAAELDAARRAAARLAQELAEARAAARQQSVVPAASGMIEDLTARLTRSEADRRDLEERVAALTKEVANNYSRLKRLESMNAELRETVGQLNASLAEHGGGLRQGRAGHLNAPALRQVDEFPR